MTKLSLRNWLVLAMALGLTLALRAADTNTNSVLAPGLSSLATNTASAPPPLRVCVDPRVELMSLLFRLAGNREYNETKVASYAAEVDQHFLPFRDHAAVRLARQLHQHWNISFNAPVELAVQVTDVRTLQLVPSHELGEVVPGDPRWQMKPATNFLAAARQFVQDSGFQDFLQQHQGLYDTTAARMRTFLEKEGHLEWFQAFFGEGPHADFTVTVGLLTGAGNYGLHTRDAAGHEEMFSIVGVWYTDRQGLPVFPKQEIPTLVHEFCHSYANPVVFRHREELKRASQKLYRAMAGQMRSHGYSAAEVLAGESLVRACVVRYLLHYEGPQAAEREMRLQQRAGFLWTRELSDLLGQYEAQRDQYPTLESFSPRLVAFFNNYAKDLKAKLVAEAEQEKALDSRRPQVVSVTPVNGARNVDPGLTTIQVVFDRPMNGESNYGPNGPQLPKTTRSTPYFDAQRTTWTMPVDLKPDWEYRFYLNVPGDCEAFQSREGVPLKSFLVKFKTTHQKGR